MRTTDVVLRHVERLLDRGELAVGMRLPGERALAEQLGVSRGSVREALQVLTTLGVVRRATGSGDAAGAVVVADSQAGLGAAVRLHVATRAFPVRDVVQTRVLLESWSVAEAARHDGPLGEIHDLLDAMDRPEVAVPDFLRLDAQLHVALAARSGNALVAEVMVSLRGAIEAYVQRAVPLVDDWPAVLDRLRVEHREIVAAVARGDATAASRAVTGHIEGFYELSGLA